MLILIDGVELFTNYKVLSNDYNTYIHIYYIMYVYYIYIICLRCTAVNIEYIMALLIITVFYVVHSAVALNCALGACMNFIYNVHFL